MFDHQHTNLTKTKLQLQLQQKLFSLHSLTTKVTQMNNKLTTTTYQKVNSVMMRKVEIKHTSEFLIKLNDEFYAEVKTATVLQNLEKKKKDCEELLKKVGYKVEMLEKKMKKNKQGSVDVKGGEETLDNKYQKTSMESIGKNQQGEDIFNIIEVEGEEEEDISQWGNSNSNTNAGQALEGGEKKEQKKEEKKYQKKQQKKKDTKKQQPSQKIKQTKPSEVQGGDLLLDQGEYSQDDSSIDQESSDGENEMKEKRSTQPKPQSQSPFSFQQNPTPSPTPKQRPPQQPTTSPQKPEQKPTKPQPQPQPQPPKPISRFKLERMKQKLEESL